MKMKDLFLEELKREEAGTRKALERVPEGQNDWAPHEKSMQMGYLASLVATMPAWIDMMINQDELDFAPVDPAKQRKPLEWTKTSELIDLFDQNMKRGIAALESTTDEHLMTNWKLLAAGHLISDEPRYVNIMNGMLMHWAHHRGQRSISGCGNRPCQLSTVPRQTRSSRSRSRLLVSAVPQPGLRYL